MTKEELLANLKPLCWSELEDDDNHLFICNTLFGDYVIFKTPYIISIKYNYYSLKFNGDNIGCFDYEEAKDQAWQHYCNLVLNLFNLNEENYV